MVGWGMAFCYLLVRPLTLAAVFPSVPTPFRLGLFPELGDIVCVLLVVFDDCGASAVYASCLLPGGRASHPELHDSLHCTVLPLVVQAAPAPPPPPPCL